MAHQYKTMDSDNKQELLDKKHKNLKQWRLPQNKKYLTLELPEVINI